MASGDSSTTKPESCQSSRRLMASVVGVLLLVGAGLVIWLKSDQSDVPAAKPPIVAVAPSPAQPVTAPSAPAVAKPELPPGISGDPMEAFAWDGKLQGMHIMSMCKDIRGRLWVGTEGNGVWCWDPNVALKQLQAEQAWAIERKRLGTPESAAPAKAKLYGWSQHTRVTTGGKPEEHGPVLTTGTSDVNSLGDDCVYAIACDKQGRIWTGHLNHGVSVYDGRQIPIKQPEKGYEGWRNYDVLSGPLGERVFDIGVNPVDGDVWIATDAGLSRYRVAADTWNYYTRADGLPADQVQALAFLKDGSVVAGTQCDGLGIATPAPKAQPAVDKAVASTLEYPTWRHVTTEDNSYDLPKTPIGVGLPSNLINDLLVTRDGTLWVATTTGIAKSTDGGKTWIFIRGEDWEAKLRGLAEPPTNDEINIAKQLVPIQPQALLLEDYTTTIAEDSTGNLWFGHWRRGLEIMNPKGERLYPDPKVTIVTPANAYIRAIEPNLLWHATTGCYGGGLTLEPNMAWQKKEMTLPQSGNQEVVTLPKPAAVPIKEEFVAVTDWLSKPILPKEKEPWGKFVGDDWMTQGDWIGRYGRKRVLFPGTGGAFTNKVGYEPSAYNAIPYLGPTHKEIDKPRGWCWELKNNQDRRIMYFLPLGIRRPAGWDDHGEVYPVSSSGPDLWIKLSFPKEGMSLVTFHFMNYDGLTGGNRLRDYTIELRTELYGGEVLARARVNNFWGGVYKQFAVSGKENLYLKISRNHSFNVMLLGVLFDKIQGPLDPADKMNLHILYLRKLKEYRLPSISSIKEIGDVKVDQNVFIFWRIADPCHRGKFIRYIKSNYPSSSTESYIKWLSDYWTLDDRLLFLRATKEADNILDKQNIRR